MEEGSKNNSKTLIIIIISVLVLCMAALVWAYLGKSRENEEMLQLFEIEKEEMENEYSSFAVQYDELQVHISNDSLVHQLEKEKLRTQQLLEELRQTKATNAAEITRLKKELSTVRAVLKTYVAQIDSLDQINKQLVKENTKVKAQYKEAASKIDKLTEEKQLAEEKIELASQLDAAAITITPRNKREKLEKKVKNVVQFKIDFTIVKNITTQPGEKTVYVQIAKPDGEVLVKSDGGSFKYLNTTLPWSIRKYIEYTGEQQEVTVWWNVEEFLVAGTYNVYIFVDGTMIGEQSFTLQ